MGLWLLFLRGILNDTFSVEATASDGKLIDELERERLKKTITTSSRRADIQEGIGTEYLPHASLDNLVRYLKASGFGESGTHVQILFSLINRKTVRKLFMTSEQVPASCVEGGGEQGVGREEQKEEYVVEEGGRGDEEGEETQQKAEGG
jgi:hypothetical protein